MKQGSNSRRGRPRSGGKRHPSSRLHSVESAGPDVKVRGSAQQVLDKYLALARDAISAGDRVAAEGYFQYADHYYRLVHADGGGSNGQGQPNQGNRGPVAPAPVSGHVPAPVPLSAPLPATPAADPFETASDDDSAITGLPPKTEPETSPA